jgi:RelE toxin of RelEB toxin-antitoxin system
LQRIFRRTIFVELSPFIAFRNEYWSDEDLRSLQNFLLDSPDAGDVIPGGSGLRKLRWSAQGHGKRGGARVIYYRHVPGDRIYLIYAYMKNVRSDLTREQIKVLAQLMKDIKNG